MALKIPLMFLCSHICRHDVGLCAQWQPSQPADNDERALLFSTVPHLLEYLPFHGQGRKEADIFQASKLIEQGDGGCVLKLEPAVLRKYELWTRPDHIRLQSVLWVIMGYYHFHERRFFMNPFLGTIMVRVRWSWWIELKKRRGTDLVRVKLEQDPVYNMNFHQGRWETHRTSCAELLLRATICKDPT